MGCETEAPLASTRDESTDALVHGLVAVGARWCENSRRLHLCETSLHCPLPVSRLQWRRRNVVNDIGSNGSAGDTNGDVTSDDSSLLALPVYLNASRSTFVAEVSKQQQ